ncbi:MAG TPA: hypothetical protein VJ873_06140 [bacterium]|nr:hypothetical protein [bacterium]
MRKNESVGFRAWAVRKRKQISKLKADGQVLGTALIMGAVILIFALAMVSMLSTNIKLSQKVNSGNYTTLGADAAIAKGIEALKQGNNWGVVSASTVTPVFTPIVGYKADIVYTDIPHTEYVVQINPGNLINPPGDINYERTISVEMYTLPVTVAQPSTQPTPWTQSGGSVPSAYSNHRVLQAVVKRGTFNSAIDAGGAFASNGNFTVYWGNVYDYYQDPTCTGAPPCTAVTTISMGNNQTLGPGYPAFHTQYGCISTSNNCAGCFGGASSSGSGNYCLTTDTGAINPCQIYPNDPNMPPRPVVQLDYMKAQAKNIYTPGKGQPGAGINSGESGYFYSLAMTPGPGVNSVAVAPTPGPGNTANESNHQYNGSFSISSAQSVLTRMQQNLGLSSSTWVGNDDMYFFVDTLDGLPVNSSKSNEAGGPVDFKHFYFRGTFVLLSDFQDNGPGGISIGTVQAPTGWCPTSANLSPDFNGFLYISGDITKLNGTPSIYGSVDLEGTFSAKGNVKIYYRSDFNYSQVESGTLVTEQWKEVSTFPAVLH